MGRHSRRRAAPSLPLAIGIALAVVVQVVAGVTVVRHRDDAAALARAGAAIARRADSAAASARRAALEERAGSVRRLLDTRAHAVLTRDRALFLSTVDPASPEFRQRQARMFDALAGVPLGSWTYVLDPDRETPYDPAALGDYGDETWVPDVVLRYQLAEFDPEPTVTTQLLTFVRREAGWVIADDADFAGVPGRDTDRELWDLGPVEVVRGSRTLVLGRPGRRALLAEIARQADASVPVVSRVWGGDWSQRVVVVVPETQDELGTIIAEGKDLSQIAAVAVAKLGDGAGRPRTVGNRIIVNPPNFAKLSRVGRQVVLQHEITHVATRDHTGPASPTWLVEGFADYVGYLGSGVSVRTASRELRAEIRAGRVPTALPAEEEFGGTNPRLAQSYEMAWLACRLIVARTSEAALVRFYRAVGSGAGPPAQVLAAAFAAELSTTPQSFTAAWRDYLRAELG